MNKIGIIIDNGKSYSSIHRNDFFYEYLEKTPNKFKDAMIYFKYKKSDRLNFYNGTIIELVGNILIHESSFLIIKKYNKQEYCVIDKVGVQFDKYKAIKYIFENKYKFTH